MKKNFLIAFVFLFAAQICYAASSTLDRSTADTRARQSFTLRSVDGNYFDVRIVGDNEKLLNDWFWAQDDEIYAGDYFAYVAAEKSSTFELQSVQVFANNYGGENPQRINLTRDNRDGFCVVRGVNNLPDLLVSKIQVTGGGYFDMKIFAVKNGRLLLVKFLGEDKKTLNESFNTYSKPTTYLDNGTISVPWHTNAVPDAGTYETVYMLDTDNLILIPAYTNKTWSPTRRAN